MEPTLTARRDRVASLRREHNQQVFVPRRALSGPDDQLIALVPFLPCVAGLMMVAAGSPLVKAAGLLVIVTWAAVGVRLRRRALRARDERTAAAMALGAELASVEREMEEGIASSLSSRYGVRLEGSPAPGRHLLAHTPRGVERVQYLEVDGTPVLLRGDVELERLSSATPQEGSTA